MRHKTHRIEIRVTLERKARLKQLSQKRKISLTDMLLAALDRQPLRDYRAERQVFTSLKNFSNALEEMDNHLVAVTTLSPDNTDLTAILSEYQSRRIELCNQLKTLLP